MSNSNSEQIRPVGDGTLTIPNPAPCAKFEISAVVDGFPVTISCEGRADALSLMIQKLKGIGAVPPASSALKNSSEPTNDDAPTCEFHGKMKKGNYGWFCPKKMGDGSYCKSKG